MKLTLWDNVRQSLFNLIDHQLLENGAYINVSGGQKDPRGNDLSKLYPVVDNELYSNSGHIWQSAFHNWVYESNIQNNPAPIVCSGVFINGVFTPKSDSIHIDYVNGRVIFDTAQSVTGNIQAAFSHKEYSFVRPDNNVFVKDQTKFVENSPVYKTPFPATPYSIHLPAIFLEIEQGDEKGWEFGGTHESLPIFKVLVLSTNLRQVEGIASVCMRESTRSLPVVSANLGPKLNYYNDITETYSFAAWVTQLQNYALIKSVKYNRFYEAKSELTDPPLFGGVLNIEISAIR